MRSRFFGLVSAAMLSSLGFGATASAETLRAYIGTYTTDGSSSRGIYTCLFDNETGKLTAPELAAESINPSFLAIHPTGRAVYAVNEVVEGTGRGNGGVSSFAVSNDGRLRPLNQRASLGGAPCHANVDATGKWLLIANYIGGNVVVFPIGRDGKLGESSSVIDHEGFSIDPQRQRQPHAHSINLSRDNRFAYAADLGIDQVKIYRFDAQLGKLSPASPDSVSIAAGGGPRHFAIDPTGLFAFTNHELTAMVTAFRRDPESGKLTPTGTASTLPEGSNSRRSTAECLVHPSGRFVYVSNRGHDSIAVFSLNADSGKLTRVEIVGTEGQEPRNFYIEPSGRWLLAANQNSDTITVFAIDAETGKLSFTGQRVAVGRPVCIRMLPSAPNFPTPVVK